MAKKTGNNEKLKSFGKKKKGKHVKHVNKHKK